MDDAGFEDALLLGHGHLWHGVDGLEMGPAIGITTGKSVVVELGKEGADGDVHEVLLLLFGEFFSCGCLSKFIDAYQEQDAFEVGDFAESFV